MKIVPVVISRTGTFNVKTLARIVHSVFFKEEPLDVLTLKQLPTIFEEIGMTLSAHAQEWLSYISKTFRKILATKTRKTTIT